MRSASPVLTDGSGDVGAQKTSTEALTEATAAPVPADVPARPLRWGEEGLGDAASEAAEESAHSADEAVQVAAPSPIHRTESAVRSPAPSVSPAPENAADLVEKNTCELIATQYALSL